MKSTMAKNPPISLLERYTKPVKYVKPVLWKRIVASAKGKPAQECILLKYTPEPKGSI